MKCEISGLAAASPGLVPDIRTIKDPVPIADPWLWIWLLAGALVLMVLGRQAWRWWQKRKQRPRPVTPPIPPADRARHRLEAALKLITEPKRFCTEVSGAVRAYFEDQFQYRAPERTTEEFLAELQRAHFLSTQQRDLMSEFLMRCDLVKFARYEPAEDELRAVHASALRLVNTTEPPPSLPAPPGTATPAGAPQAQLVR